MNKANDYMKDTIINILEEGFKDINPRPKYSDGTPAHTLSVNHVYRTYDLSNGIFPICSLRPIAWKTAIKEILWIYQDQTSNLTVLNDNYNIHYWNDWESEIMPHTIGARYGATVRRYNLIENLINGIKTNPYGRRHIMDLYQYEEFNRTDGLYPCAFCSIWNIRNTPNGDYLDMALIQRSGDMLTASGAGGINEVQYMALLMMVAHTCNYKVGKFSHFVANEQIYDRHIEQSKEMLKRYNELFLFEETSSEKTKSPKLIFSPKTNDFFEYTIDDFTLENYNPIKPQLKFDLGI